METGLNQSRLPTLVGRGSSAKPANRFEAIHIEEDYEQLEADDELLVDRRRVKTVYLEDDSKSILTENRSPDIPFRYSLNPYRGCAHGCAYCYARPTHEYLGFNAGIDFESQILVKRNAPELLRKHLSKRSWQVEPIMFSGVTDCYQPVERELEVTRSCLQVADMFRQPLGVITKNALVTRDLDLLAPMAAKRLSRVAVSLTSLDQKLTRSLEPRTSSPAARLRAIQELSEAGVEVTVMVAPVIPGLNDTEIPALLEAARDHGAKYAGYVLLRLPLTVEQVFVEWLEREAPDRSEKVQSLVQQTRGGKMNQSDFGQRMRGTGEFADHLSSTFKLFAKKFGLERNTPPLDCSQFSVPSDGDAGNADKQLRLF